jgi:HNH endonuclease
VIAGRFAFEFAPDAAQRHGAKAGRGRSVASCPTGTTSPIGDALSSRRRWVPTRRYNQARAVLLARATCCGICGLPFKAGDKIHCDHVLPVSLGGSDHLSNLRATHAVCNIRRGAGKQLPRLAVGTRSRVW